jgi:hypothetical protein
MNYHPEYQDRIDTRASRRQQQRNMMAGYIFVATIFTAGLVCGWAITVATTIK